ncbi:GntP family permease [Autumnicola psychrophila]|uniref:GntP family permease n=1 Tax=Autumnicola psychrophila TaxID=3075592 RepID=A0ABU3DMS1_9FLAO|nr:GntP family permease [Zunongwangia sp. F225]MDT0684981.1 GntP family permease [Zunongwangia sp. F225]
MTVILLLLSVALIIILTARFQVHPFLALFLVAVFYGLLIGMPLDAIILSVNQGFGNTLGSIGLIIVFGVIIGAFLEKSGGAYALAEKALQVVGKKRVSAAMGFIGYIVSIPVYADSGFILLSPLNRSLAKKAGISLAGPAVALGLGLTATHTMVPPTPGPIAAAGILGADLGLVMLLAVPISALALIVGVVFATKYAAKTWIDPNPDISEKEIQNRLDDAPGAFKSSIPVFVPIILIVLKSITANDAIGMHIPFLEIIFFLGEPIVALCIGAILSLSLPKKLNAKMLSSDGWVGNALRDAASVLLITGAGGIFGRILQDSGIATTLGETLAEIDISIWLPFLLAAAIKSAQGSSTVALITTASIMLPMMTTLGFDSELEKALVVVAIGSGSAVVSHANDSFFWVVSQMSGMKVKTGYRLYTTGTFILGTSAAFFIYLIYLIVA